MGDAPSFIRPTFDDLLARVRREYGSRIPGGDAFLAQGVLPRLAEVDAALVHGLHGHLDWAARQALPLFAEAEYLDAWGEVWGVTRKAASAASGGVVFQGADGAVIPLGTACVRADGLAYTVTSGGTVVGGTAEVTVEADAPGAAGNTAAGTAVSLASPILGLTAKGAVGVASLGGGADVEGDEALRARILARIHAPPHGGASYDYEAWTLQVPGVTRVWVAPQELGRGSVTVRFAMDGTYADGIPQAGDVAAVQAHLDTVRPVTAEVVVVAPVAHAIDVIVAGLSPDSPAVRAAIAAELADMMRRRAAPGQAIYRSWLWEAVSAAIGEQSHDLVAPAATVAVGVGEVAVLGEVSYA